MVQHRGVGARRVAGQDRAHDGVVFLVGAQQAAVHPELGKAVGALAADRMGGARGLQALAEPPPPRAIVAGDRWDPSCAELRRFLERNQISFRWVIPGANDAESQWGGPLPAAEDRPSIRIIDGKTVVRPQLRRVAELLGVSTEAAEAEYDVVATPLPSRLAALVEQLETQKEERKIAAYSFHRPPG